MDYTNLSYSCSFNVPMLGTTLGAPAFLTGGPPPFSGAVELVTLGGRPQPSQKSVKATSVSDTESSDEGHNSGEDQEPKDPFAPECSVPLPFQIGDEYGYYGPNAVWKRNERERHRVRCVNDGYERLRVHLPMYDRFNFTDREKRLSKVDTLRLAIRYIKHLNAMLVDYEHYRVCTCYAGFTLTTDVRAIRKSKNNKQKKKKLQN